jgi:hypothetical protein
MLRLLASNRLGRGAPLISSADDPPAIVRPQRPRNVIRATSFGSVLTFDIFQGGLVNALCGFYINGED